MYLLQRRLFTLSDDDNKCIMVSTDGINTCVAQQHYSNTHSHKENEMKQFFNTIYEILESLGRAKAAAALSRQGLHEEAKKLMLAS
jgi:hypothetical protein